MIVAILVSAAAALLKLGIYGYCSIKGTCALYQPGFPTEVWLLMGMLVLPKTIGRASAGRVWEKLGLGGKPDA